MTDLKIEAPIKVEVKIIVVGDDGVTGEVTYELPAMKFPTRESIVNAIFETAGSDVLTNNGLRVANQKETFDYIVKERTGLNTAIALPGSSEDWYE